MAGSAGGIRAGRAYVELGSKDSELVKGLKQAETKVKAFGAGIASIGTKIGAIGTAIATPMLGAVRIFSVAGSELNDMSVRTGISVEALSALGHAATQTGTDLGTVEGGIRKMQKSLVAGSEENMSAAGTFASLGLSVEKLSRLRPEQQFEAIAKTIAKIPNPTARAGAAMSIFGKSGTALLPMIEDLAALTKEAKDFGLVWSGDEAKKADALGDALDLVTEVGKRVVTVIGSALAPLLTDLAGQVAQTGKRIMDWVGNNKELVVTIFKVGLVLVAAGALVVGLGIAFSALGAVLGGIATAIGVVGSILGAILSPVGLVIAGLVGLTAWFLTSTQAGGQALAWLGERFDELKGDAVAAFNGIADALKAGDIALAGQILWAALKVEWLKGVLFLKGVWSEWGTFAVGIWESISFELASIMTDAWAGIQVIWATAMADLEGSWGSLIERMIKMFIPVGDVIAQALGIDIQKTIDDALANIGVGPGGEAAAKTRKQALDTRLGGIESDRQQSQESIDDQQRASIDARRKAAKEGLAQTAAELAAAQGQFASLNEQAAQEAGKATGVTGKKPRPFTPEGLDLSLQQAQQKVETKGTFSAAALRGLGFGDTAGEQLKEQKKSNEQLKQLNDKARRGQIVFNES